MSGHLICTNDETPDRRRFLKSVLGIGAVFGIAANMVGCNTREGKITGSIVGANSRIGHKIRDGFKFPSPTKTLETNVFIGGGGIAGLSAMRRLKMNGVEDVMLVELDKQLGGNSTYGKNAVSAYPWAAHYLPIPVQSNKDLIDFLRSINVITGFDKQGIPTYNEYYICHAPEERLYINGHWQDGVVPYYGISNEDEQQIGKFFHLVNELKYTKGNDGLDVFSIPVDSSSKDQAYRDLDKETFSSYLKRSGYTSTYLLWYLEYCCKDDFGATINDVSAWAGLHYFAARKGKATNAKDSSILTWPEGNGFLMNELKKQCSSNKQVNMAMLHVQNVGDKVEVLCYDISKNETVKIIANKLLLATPQYINNKLLNEYKSTIQRDGLSYAPWVVANITMKGKPVGKGAALSWDNVIYGKDSVGYVYANHQDVKFSNRSVLTYYLPITGKNCTDARKSVQGKEYSYWKDYFLDELNYVHPGIKDSVEHIDVWVWGHGMIRPDVGYIWSDKRKQLMNPINDKVFFAHSDLSGISTFEEAFAQGIRAADEITASI